MIPSHIRAAAVKAVAMKASEKMGWYSVTDAGEKRMSDHEAGARLALQALATELGKAGYVIVPLQPTAHMIEEGHFAAIDDDGDGDGETWRSEACYRAMIAAKDGE